MRRTATRSSAPLLGAALFLLCGPGCSKPDRVEPPEGTVAHVGSSWFEHRGKTLGISAQQAEARDAGLAEDTPPPTALDRHTAIEAAIVFRQACATCHGDSGVPPRAVPGGPKRPKEWGTFGTRMGFFFGGDSMRAGIYRRIRDGGEAKDGVVSDMPAWRGSLSREQMWALTRHIESF